MRPPKPPYLLGQLTRHPGARVKLFCGACTWSRTYDAARIAARLDAKQMLRPSTLIADVARHVPWPCPACGRMRWATAPAPPVRRQFLENPTIPPRVR